MGKFIDESAYAQVPGLNATAMHDLEFDHLHVPPGDEINEVAWSADNVELTTVGIDIGSSTSHLMFARVHLQRLAHRAVEPLRGGQSQDAVAVADHADALPARLHHRRRTSSAASSAAATPMPGSSRGDIDSGAVILTGEAIKRHNARAIADLFSEEAGKFVCASAGHHMECQLAAHGSGAVALSRGHAARILNVDIGGGTTKLALIENGTLVATAAIAVGGRLLVEDAKAGLTRIEEPVREIAGSLGITLALGEPLAAADRERIVARMVRADHAHDRPAARRRADRAPPGDRPVAGRGGQSRPRRPHLLGRRRRISLQAREAAHSAISASISPARSPACWRAGATCRRSGTRARASARP